MIAAGDTALIELVGGPADGTVVAWNIDYSPTPQIVVPCDGCPAIPYGRALYNHMGILTPEGHIIYVFEGMANCQQRFDEWTSNP